MTLVEVLVTLVIISVGLLGVAALQLVSLRDNVDAHVRSQASALAGDILDRMRANRTILGEYAVSLGGTGTVGTVPGADLASWQTTLDKNLPSGQGAISIDDNVVTIQIQWGERGVTLNFWTRTEI